jgi:prepilin peptidase CpaA
MAVATGIGIWVVAVGLIDAATARIPNWTVLMGLVAGVLLLLVQRHGVLGAGLMASGAGFAVGGLIPLSGYAAGALGAGDVKLAAALGLLLGLHGVVWVLLIAALLMGIASLLVVLRIRFLKKRGRARIPAGPALAIGTLFVLFNGPAIFLA